MSPNEEAAPLDESEAALWETLLSRELEGFRDDMRAEVEALIAHRLQRLRNALGDILEREAAGPSYEIARAALSEQEPASA